MTTSGPASPSQGVRFGRLSDEIPSTGETFVELAALLDARIEHIVSSASPDTSVQVQDWDEWVLLTTGTAELEVAGDRIRLTAGEWLLLPAGTPHRVLTTRPGTHWIAVHAAGRPADHG